ncbi:MAG: hypothetical protein WAV18_23820, partial [Roseiarcus sp.]
PRKRTLGGRLQIGILAGFRSESVAGFLLECMAGFVGIRTLGSAGSGTFADAHRKGIRFQFFILSLKPLSAFFCNSPDQSLGDSREMRRIA